MYLCAKPHCRVPLTPENAYENLNQKSGLDCYCRKCRLEYSKSRMRSPEAREAKKAYNRKRYAENPIHREHRKKYQKQWRDELRREEERANAD